MRHPLGLGCLTRESALASIWFAKNAPHRIINVGGGKIRVGGSCPKYPPPYFPRFSPFSPRFPPGFPRFSSVFPRFSPFFPVFPCYWEPNADWVWEPWTPEIAQGRWQWPTRVTSDRPTPHDQVTRKHRCVAERGQRKRACQCDGGSQSGTQQTLRPKLSPKATMP